MEEEKTMTVKEAAKFLRMSEKTIYDLVSRDALPYFRASKNGTIRFVKSQLIKAFYQGKGINKI